MDGQFAPETVDTTEFSPRQRWRMVQEIISSSLEGVAAGVSSAAKQKAEMDTSGQRSKGGLCCACFGFKTSQRTMASRLHHWDLPRERWLHQSRQDPMWSEYRYEADSQTSTFTGKLGHKRPLRLITQFNMLSNHQILVFLIVSFYICSELARGQKWSRFWFEWRNGV